MADVFLAYTLGYEPVSEWMWYFTKQLWKCVCAQAAVLEKVSLLWQEQGRCERCSLAVTAAETSCLSTPPGVMSSEVIVYF